MSLTKNEKEALTQQLNKEKYDEILERERVSIENRNKSRNLLRLLQIQRKEQEEADEILGSKERAASKELLLNQEENLARELDNLRRQELCDSKYRQLLRETSPELKELERKLKLAYANRELHAQMEEVKQRKLEEKLKCMENRKIIEQARANEIELATRMKQNEIIKKHEYKAELQNQMILKDQMKRHQYEEFLREKKLIDAVVQRIHLEDERALHEKWEKMKKSREEMEEFKRAQQIWREKKLKEIALEDQKIQEYMFSKQSDDLQKAEEKKKKDQAKEDAVNKIATQIYDERMKAREREDIQTDLMVLENIAASEAREKNELEKHFRLKLNMVSGLDMQLKEREEQRKRLAEEDEYYRKLIEQQTEEEKKLDLLSNEKKRIRKLQLRKDLNEMMEKRRQRNAENMQIMLKLHEQELEEIAERNRKIEEERLRMLKEHAENIIGYIPRGILKESDLEVLGPNVAEVYGKQAQNSKDSF